MHVTKIIVSLHHNNKQIEIMSIQEKTQRENLESLKGQLEYSTYCLINRINEMEDFEVKSFLSANLDYRNEIVKLENHIKSVF